MSYAHVAMPFGYCDLRWLHGVCTFFRGGRSPEFFWITSNPAGVFQRMLVVGFVPLPTLRWLTIAQAVLHTGKPFDAEMYQIACKL